VSFLTENWALIMIALTSGAFLMLPALQASGGGLSPSAAVLKINREKAILIDVSEPEEFSRAHPGGAHNLPFGQVEERIGELVRNKSTPVILVCPSGSRAARAAGLLRKLGYEQSQALSGGLKAWQEANLPVERAASA